MRVLIVDDSPTILAVATDQLEAAGFEVLVARGGEEGIDTAKEWTPDCIVMDIEMPYRGDKAAKALRCDDATANIPIIALTSHSRESLGDNANLFNAFLVKPFGLSELVSKIREILEIL